MKKLLNISMMLLVCSAMAFTSCKKDEDTSSSGGGGTGGGGTGGGTTITNAIAVGDYLLDDNGLYYSIVTASSVWIDKDINETNYASLPETLVIPDKIVCDGKTYDVTGFMLEEFETYYYIGPFKYNQTVRDLTIPKSIISTECACKHMKGLKSVSIPNTINTIESSAFMGCSNLTKVTIPNGIDTIGLAVFHSCSNLTEINIPNSVSYIGGKAFSNCEKLTSITIPDGVPSIGSETFAVCSSLKKINIPNSVTYIGNAAFFECSSLTEIKIPNSVTKIDYPFVKCPSLTSIYCAANNPPIGFNEIFGVDSDYLNPTATLYVPFESIDAYKNLEYLTYSSHVSWQEYFKDIVGYDFDK